jgi:hypothetical protein
MQIHLPDVQSYFDEIRNGSITRIRLPGIETRTGDVLTAFSPSGNDDAVHLKVLSCETVPLEAVTAGEAESEGFTAPGFCPSRFLCGSIETRLDFEDYVFGYEKGVQVPRPEGERERLLREKAARLCPSCLRRRDAKDLFLNYWESRTAGGNMTKISFEITG